MSSKHHEQCGGCRRARVGGGVRESASDFSVTYNDVVRGVEVCLCQLWALGGVWSRDVAPLT
jgi:hypothetical protein